MHNKAKPFILIVLLCVLWMPVQSMGATVQQQSDLEFFINGEVYTAADGEPMPYINQDNRTMVPVRFFANAMGVSDHHISWNEESQTAELERKPYKVSITIGESHLWHNGLSVEMDTQAELTQNRTFVPVRFIAEGLGAKVFWDQANSRVTIETEEIELLSPEEAETIIAEKAEAVLTALKNKDGEALANAVHDEKGVRFTPYTHVDVEQNVTMSAAEVAEVFNSSQTFAWGHYDGSGELIELTFPAYYEQFIYDQDYLEAHEIAYNSEPLFTGNALDNAAIVYPESIIVEYHFEGFEEEYVGMDWKSLRLVFGQNGDDWQLIGIIHDQWTI